MRIDDWFLTAEERGNPATRLDRRHEGAAAWTEGNHVDVLIDGAAYYARLAAACSAVAHGGSLWFTDWEGHADERLDGGAATVGSTLVDLVRAGVAVRGLLWRSHPRRAHFAEQDNMHLAGEVNDSGGLVVLDERVRLGGSHHQKLVVLRGRSDAATSGDDGPVAGSDVAFVGGIDLCHGRHDDPAHAGDPQAVELDPRYGPRPPWHDLQLEVRGPAVDDLALSFRERWEDPTPLDHRNPLRAVQRRLLHQPRTLPPLDHGRPPPAPRPLDPKAATVGSHAVQVLRTYPVRRQAYRFAPDGERSIARAYLKAIGRARRLVAIEDQYLWSMSAASALADALRRHRELLVTIVVPRHPDRDGWLTGSGSRWARGRVIDALTEAGGRRVAVYDLENRWGTPVYVHAKACIIDDVWVEIGSDNLNRRSWTHDSEIGCAVLDGRRDRRRPEDPGGLGDGARVLARDVRLALWREHLGRAAGDDADLVDPQQGFDALRESAGRLDDWVRGGRVGPRPPGHLRSHPGQPVPRWLQPLAALTYRTVLDPDGRGRSGPAGDRY